MCVKAVWKNVSSIENRFHSACLSFLSCYSVHPSDGPFVQLFIHSTNIQVLAVHPALGWAVGTQGKLGQVLLLQAGGGEDECTLDSMGNTGYDEGKAQGMGGSPQRWPVQPEE